MERLEEAGAVCMFTCEKSIRKGIGKELMEYVCNLYASDLFRVETGLANIPAIQLYKSLGFTEVKQWDTAIGVRKIRFEKSKNTLKH